MFYDTFELSGAEPTFQMQYLGTGHRLRIVEARERLGLESHESPAIVCRQLTAVGNIAKPEKCDTSYVRTIL